MQNLSIDIIQFIYIFSEFKKNLEEIENIRISSRYYSKSKNYVQKSCPFCMKIFDKKEEVVKEFDCKHKFCKSCILNVFLIQL